MLNRDELVNYRILRGVTQSDVVANCELSKGMVSLLESGDRAITQYNYKQYVNGVNKAYQINKAKPPKPKKPKVQKPEPLESVVTKKPATKRKPKAK